MAGVLKGETMSGEQGTTPSGTQSVERAFAVLNAFLTGRPELRVSDIAKLLGLGPSTTSRLLATLESLEYVERDPLSGLYRLGPAPITLGGVAVNQHPVHREARSIAQHMAGSLGLGVNVAVRRGADVFYLLNVEGRLAAKSFTLMGRRSPLHATGLGKCLLLGLSADERRNLLPEARLTGFTPTTLTSHEKLDAELAEVSARGFATELEELALGRACIAAPIRNATGGVAAAISISGPLTAMDLPRRQDDLARALIEAADHISVGLGYLGPHHKIEEDR
jgi:DNA-binding IclR family transcriptional regulator